MSGGGTGGSREPTTDPPTVRRAVAAYRLLLRLLPRRFRDDVGPEMLAAFRLRASRVVAVAGTKGLASLIARAAFDVVVTAVAERRSPSGSAARAKRVTTGGAEAMTDLVQDLKYAARMLVKNPVFTAAAVLTLGVGIGLNTATFSAIHALLLRPLPGVEEPDELVQLYSKFRGDFLYGSNSIPQFQDLRDRLTPDVFENVAAWSFQALSLSADGRNERLVGMMVSASFFQTYGVEPVVGRVFLPGEEDRDPGAHAVAVLGHGFWRTRFGGDPGVVGRTVLLNGHPFQVVGVAPADFKSPIAVAEPPVYVPLMMIGVVMPRDGSSRLERRGTSFLQVHARLAAGVTMERAREEVAAFYRTLMEEYPDHYDETGGITFVPQSEAGMNPAFRQAQVGLSAVLMVVVSLLLLIACVNVANLFLARARERRREMGIRISLGAARSRVVRQLLTESFLFSAVAAGAGLLLALVTVRWLSGVRPPVEGPWAFDFRLDRPVLLFTVAITVAAGFLFGLAPALQAARTDASGSLKGQDRRGRPSRLSSGLVVLQMALSLLLLVSSGLFLRSLQGATRIDKGFTAENLLLASMDPGLQGYSREEAEAFYRDLLERVRSLPGVRSASLAEVVPLGLGSQQNGVEVPGYEFAPDERSSIDYNVVGPGYFETMGIRALEGRGFTEADGPDAPPVAVVNRRFAERFWPGESALGKTFQAGRAWEVVGVVETGKYNRLGEDPLPFMYFPHAQQWEFGLTLHVRTAGDPGAQTGAVREAIASLDPELPVFDVRSMENHLGFALLPAVLGGTVLGLFGGIGLLLAAVGIYGVMSYSVTQRSRELGIRLALGAERGRVVRLVLGEGLRLALIGTVLGLAGAALASRLVQGLLYGVDPLDPVAFGVVPIVLVAVAALAVWVPARRAAAADPMQALRSE